MTDLTHEFDLDEALREIKKLRDDIGAMQEIVRQRDEAIGRYEFWNEKMRKELERLGWEMP